MHKYECGYYELLKSVGIAHLGLRVALTAAPTFNAFKKILKRLKNKKIMEDNDVVEFKALGYENVYNLVSHIAELEAQDLFQYSLVSLEFFCRLDKFINYTKNFFPGLHHFYRCSFSSIQIIFPGRTTKI